MKKEGKMRSVSMRGTERTVSHHFQWRRLIFPNINQSTRTHRDFLLVHAATDSFLMRVNLKSQRLLRDRTPPLPCGYRGNASLFIPKSRLT